jgi:hypothetical protein
MRLFEKPGKREAKLCFRGKEGALRFLRGFAESFGCFECRDLRDLEPAGLARFRSRGGFPGNEACGKNRNHVAAVRVRNFDFALV